MTVLRWLRVQWDRALAAALVAAGILALVIGWAGISGEVFAARQLPYLLSGGIGGLFLLGAGATLWLSADMRDEWHQLRRIEAQLAASKPVTPEPVAPQNDNGSIRTPVTSGRPQP